MRDGFAATRRSFRLQHWKYDLGATLIASAAAPDEPELSTLLTAWGIQPGLFAHPWETDDPR
ncbi:hypothetical protein [Streptomyces sp. NPDC055005]